MKLTHRPISAWPWPETRTPRRSRFGAKWSTTKALLLREVKQRGARDVIIELEAPDRAFRQDGQIRAAARLKGARVVVTFEDPDHSWVRYRCDQFLDWQDNVRAIALTMEAMRGPQRWGVLDGEQYHGVRAGRALPGRVMGSEEAAMIVLDIVGREELSGSVRVEETDLLKSAELTKTAVKRALIETHPDQGGSASQLAIVQACRDVLTNHHGAPV